MGSDDIGLIYMNARYYVPGIARFASADVIVPDSTNPQSFNRYGYVYNNTLKFTDPTGHDPMWCNDPYDYGGGIECNFRTLGEPMRDMYLSGYQYQEETHEAIDLLGDDTNEILASANGIVRIADSCGNQCPGCPPTASNYDVCGYTLNADPANWGVGNVVIIEYLYESLPQDIIDTLGLLPGQSLYFQYQHLGSIAVEAGEEVTLGQLVGMAGDTGISDGTHLHLEIQIGASGLFSDSGGQYTAEAINLWQNKTEIQLIVVDPNTLWNVPLEPEN